jgi:putative transposase
MRTSYPSDLTDSQWQVLEPLLPQHKLGRPRIVDLREVINAILYVLCTDCGWEYLPH